MVAGGAYYAGSRMQRGSQREAEEQARISALEAQQQYAAAAQAAPAQPAPAVSAPAQTIAQQLTEMKKLLDQGVLTQAEFDTQKARILQG
jgi:membrane protease subunit (stomatin/prohibitin family)